MYITLNLSSSYNIFGNALSALHVLSHLIPLTSVCSRYSEPSVAAGSISADMKGQLRNFAICRFWDPQRSWSQSPTATERQLCKSVFTTYLSIACMALSKVLEEPSYSIIQSYSLQMTICSISISPSKPCSAPGWILCKLRNLPQVT